MTALDYRIYDADHHDYEPDDCFTPHIEAKYKKRTVWIDRSREDSDRKDVGDGRINLAGGVA